MSQLPNKIYLRLFRKRRFFYYAFKIKQIVIFNVSAFYVEYFTCFLCRHHKLTAEPVNRSKQIKFIAVDNGEAASFSE